MYGSRADPIPQVSKTSLKIMRTFSLSMREFTGK
jgi:hypothetical protein